jgi:hypothetical protein
MGQVLHDSATTTHAIRTAIQRSKLRVDHVFDRAGGVRFVPVSSRHGWTPLLQIKIKRRDSAMFAMESRYWLVRYAAARASGPGLATMGRPVDQAAAGL